MEDFIDEGCRFELEQQITRIGELEVLDARSARKIESLEEDVSHLQDCIKELKNDIRKLIKKSGGGV